MSISGTSDEPGKRRVYYFYPDEFPELYHQQSVESQRSLQTYVEIAELLGVSESVVRGRLEQARGRLRDGARVTLRLWANG